MTRTRRAAAALAAAAALVLLPACDGGAPPGSGGGDTTSATGGLDHINHLYPNGPRDGRQFWFAAAPVMLAGAAITAATVARRRQA